MSSVFNDIDIELQIIEFTELFSQFPTHTQHKFLVYMQDELNAIDDEFCFVIETIFNVIYNYIYVDKVYFEVEKLEILLSNAVEKIPLNLRWKVPILMQNLIENISSFIVNVE